MMVCTMSREEHTCFHPENTRDKRDGVIKPVYFIFQLISDAVLAAASQLHPSLYENEEFELDIPFIHFTYSLIQARLVNFSELVHAFPDLVKRILTLRDRLDVGEMVSHIFITILNH